MAYVLVLQAVLGSVALASVPLGTQSPLCLGSGEASGPAHHPETGGAEPVHCQACLARADTPDLPPPLPTLLVDRISIELKFDAVVRTALRAPDPRRPFQPRGPPSVLFS